MNTCFRPCIGKCPTAAICYDEALPCPQSSADSDLMVTHAGYASLSIISWNMLANTPMPDLGTLNEGLENHE